MIREALTSVTRGDSLAETDAAEVMGEIMRGEATPSQLGGLLAALRLKGETADEVTGFTRTMREFALRVHAKTDAPMMDTCGTGGDGSGTFNISTAAAFVVAAAGQPVAKHGNRAASGKCGSADVLEALGAQVTLSPQQVSACIESTGLGFMFAPAFHPAMAHVAPVRRELGVRTVFNVIGPLANPAGAQTQVIGVADRKLVPLMGEALLRLGCRRALIVYGEDGLDEISLSAPTLVCEIDGAEGTGRTYHLTPDLLGVRMASRESILGGDATANARIMRDALAGREGEPVTDMVAANAGAALYASGHAPTLADGARLAFDTIRSGRATATLDAFVATTHDVASIMAR